MRLTCPQCAAIYEAPDGEIPADGRHVQCTACHTRWFVSGATSEEFSPEQIIHRLETRRPHLRAVPDPEPGPDTDTQPAEEEEFSWEGAGAPDPQPAVLHPASPAKTTAPALLKSATPPPAEPAEKRSPFGFTADEVAAATTSKQAAPELAVSTHRLDLTSVPAEKSPAAETPATATPRKGGFGTGIGLVAGLFLLLLALYLAGPWLAETIPALAPLTEAWTRVIDSWRADLAGLTR